VRPFLTAEWRDLLMLNYEAPEFLLAPLVPEGTELDAWNGRTMVSVVGFRFLDTRVWGIAFPWHRNFEEVNLRFYVRRRVGAEVRRAVVFIKELVPRRAIAKVARLTYNEPYESRPMRHLVTGTQLQYEWKRRGAWEGMSALREGAPSPLKPGSEAEFVTEHYWGYTRQRNGSTIEYRVSHPSWRVWNAQAPVLNCDARALYGAGFDEVLSARPVSAVIAEGSRVTVESPASLD
jgi:uncharacterized protein YqjF (DUF2071 family)